MSIRVISSVWANSRQSGNDLLVLLALADFADDRGVAFPAVPTLAQKCRMSPRNANRVIAVLRESGELIVEVNAGPKGANLYRVCPPTTPDNSVTPDEIVTLAKLTAPPDSSVPPPLTVLSDEPSVNLQEPSVLGGKLPVSSKAAAPCPYQAIVDLYHEAMPENPRCKILNKSRQAAIKARWAEAAKLTCKPFGYATLSEGLAAWRQFFEICAGSDFLTGKAPGSNGRPSFIADIDFLMSPSGFAKTLENKYHREVAA